MNRYEREDAYENYLQERSWAIRDSWADFLQGQTWDCWFTSTFKRAQNYALTALSKVASVLCQDRNPERAFIAAETFYLGGWHCHGLVAYNNLSPDLRDYGTYCLEDDLGRLGFAMAQPVHCVEDVCAYVSKYVTKSQSQYAEYQLLGRFWNTPKNRLLNFAHYRYGAVLDSVLYTRG